MARSPSWLVHLTAQDGLTMFPDFIRGSALWLGLLLAAPAQAGIVLNTTRVIYQAQDKEVSLVVNNSGTADILAQSWLEAQGDTENLPFVVTPPLARMAGGARQMIRVIYAGEGLPADRESVFWLNVQEIPQSAKDNQLQIAIRQRIKLFYRPAALDGDPLDAAKSLQWRVRDGQLEVSNPTPYHVSMIQIEARQQGKTLLTADSRMLAPRQSVQLPLKQLAGGHAIDLRFISINDFGAQEPYTAKVSGGETTQAIKAANVITRTE
ncbi:P pilus assembly chaperone PapD [Pseudomonas graminis]|nr:P pilus assembly chaperone PapD [Pseudomonas graminis]